MNNKLDDLALKYGTDKVNHGYTKHYFNMFEHLCQKELNILEIGVYKGASLRMWADFFPHSQIYGIDDGSSGDLCRIYDNPRIHFREGHQANNQFLTSLGNEVKKFDMIFDDGSHYSSDIIHTFQFMFGPYLTDGGYYVIEDLQCSYPPYTSLGLSARFNSKGQTAVEYIKKLNDSIHTNPNTPIESIFVYPQMTFIKKK
jgi:hypothetical protein